MIDRKLLQIVKEIVQKCDGKVNEDQQQLVYEIKQYLHKLKSKQFTCWSCNISHSKLLGISLDDSQDVHVCDSCWNKIPQHWRLMARKWFMDNPGPRSDVVQQLIVEALKPRSN